MLKNNTTLSIGDDPDKLRDYLLLLYGRSWEWGKLNVLETVLVKETVKKIKTYSL